MPDITSELQRLRSRIVRRIFVGRLVTCGLIAAALFLVVGCIRLFQGLPPWSTSGFLLLLLASPVAALIWAWLQRPTLEETAAHIDAAAGTRDRFLTRYRFASENTPTDLQKLAVAECDAFIERFDSTGYTRPHVSRQALWVIAPLIAVLLLQWQYRIANRPTAESIAAQAELEQKADEIEQLRKQIQKAADALQSEELERIADEMKRSEESLRTERDRGARAEAKRALRELSALEAMVAAMQEQAEASDENLDALAEALAEEEETKDAAEALKKGDLAKAQEELEKALEELEQRKEEETDEELAELRRAISEALQQLTEAQRQQMAKQARQQQQQQQQASKSSRNAQQSDTKQAMKNLLQALQNMKYGEQKSGKTAQGQPQPGGEPSGTMSLSFGQGPEGEEPGMPLPGIPGGEPGTENDEGTTDSPFGGRQAPIADQGTASQLSGSLGEGESLSDLVLATGDQTKSTRRYRELYEAAANDAEDAVLQENIPLGSRFYIRRYFESIRPEE